MESKKEYLRRILEVKVGEPGYADMDTFMREYNSFLKAFNFDEIRNGEIENIFIDFHKKGITPAKLVELKKGKEELKKQLQDFCQKTKDYYETEIKGKRYKEFIRTRSPKHAQIELWDLERIHSLTGQLSNVTVFVAQLDKWWNDFTDALYTTVDLIFSGGYENSIIRTNEFDTVVEEQISYYRRKVEVYEASFEHDDIYYVGKNDNPYKNIFLFCLNAYIRNFYPIDIITMQPGAVDKLTHMVMPQEKKKYTLDDVARAYADMSGEPYEKSYEKIKKQFRKSLFMQEMKNGRSYEFDRIEIPLATYIYYSKKNHVEPEFSRLFQNYDPFIHRFYAPLLRANMRGEHKKLVAFNSYAEFVNNEFRKLTQTVNDAYLETFLEEIFMSSLYLKYRCYKGFDLEGCIEGKIP